MRFEVNQETPFIQLLRSIAEHPQDWLFVLNYDEGLKTTFIIHLEHILENKDKDSTCMKVWGWLGEHFPDGPLVLRLTHFLFIEFIEGEILTETPEETHNDLDIKFEADELVGTDGKPTGTEHSVETIKDLFKDLELDEPQTPENNGKP